MPVGQVGDLPPEGPPLVGKRFEVEHLGDGAVGADLVAVDDGHERAEAVLRGVRGGLPDLTRGLLAVAEQAHHAGRAPPPADPWWPSPAFSARRTTSARTRRTVAASSWRSGGALSVTVTSIPLATRDVTPVSR